MIKHECPECGQSIESSDRLAGDEAICPECDASVTVPLPPMEAPDPPPLPPGGDTPPSKEESPSAVYQQYLDTLPPHDRHVMLARQLLRRLSSALPEDDRPALIAQAVNHFEEANRIKPLGKKDQRVLARLKVHPPTANPMERVDAALQQGDDNSTVRAQVGSPNYPLAVAACVAEGLAYVFVGALLGWKRGGGILPMMILFAVWSATWAAIAKRPTEDNTSSDLSDDEIAGNSTRE